MKVAYERVSTMGQSLERQDYMMEKYGIEKVFVEKASGKNAEREQLKAMLAFVRQGDELYTASICRLARNVRDFLAILDTLEAKGVKLISLKENIDTSTPTGRFMVNVMASLAELEREQTLQRQREGIEAKKAAGTYKAGRPRVEVDEKKLRDICKKWRAGEMTAVEAMEKAGMKKASFYRKVNELGL